MTCSQDSGYTRAATQPSQHCSPEMLPLPKLLNTPTPRRVSASQIHKTVLLSHLRVLQDTQMSFFFMEGKMLFACSMEDA